MKLTHLITCALVVVAGMAVPVLAQEGGRGMIAPIPSPRPMPPVPPDGWTCVWVAPEYRTVTERNWIPERIEWVAEWREITPGRLEQVWRQVVIPGRWETTTRRVLVSEGHWELVRIAPPPPPRPPIILPPPVIIRNPGTVGVDGYRSGVVEDLSKFSPLTEWPK